eukprot:COSAG01_NODE_6990_length_3400_cov_10.349485_3_plen_58_part_00
MKAATEQAEAEKAEMMALLERERAEREAIDAQLAALKAKLVRHHLHLSLPSLAVFLS